MNTELSRRSLFKLTGLAGLTQRWFVKDIAMSGLGGR